MPSVKYTALIFIDKHTLAKLNPHCKAVVMSSQSSSKGESAKGGGFVLKPLSILFSRRSICSIESGEVQPSFVCEKRSNGQVWQGRQP